MKKQKYDPGDIIFVPMQVDHVEVFKDIILYRVQGGNDIDGNAILIPEDKIACGIHVAAIETMK